MQLGNDVDFFSTAKVIGDLVYKDVYKFIELLPTHWVGVLFSIFVHVFIIPTNVNKCYRLIALEIGTILNRERSPTIMVGDLSV